MTVFCGIRHERAGEELQHREQGRGEVAADGASTSGRVEQKCYSCGNRTGQNVLVFLMYLNYSRY
uniref:Uncharacterized protein n=1 Tax=Aegilops tauschii TaxID=37682 RepID=M8D462_AEGTA